MPYGTISDFANSEDVNHGMQGKTSWDSIIDTGKIMQISNRILRKNGKMVLFAQQPFTTELISKAIPNLPHNYNMYWDKMHFANCLIANKAPVSYIEDVLVFSKRNAKNDIDSENEIRYYLLNERLKTELSYKQINVDCCNSASNGGGMASNILTSYKKGCTFPTKEKYEALQKIGICLKPYEELKKDFPSLNINNDRRPNASPF